jgi:biopolymer transport protein ExbD
MRIPSTYRDRRASVELQLTPMIDCVFLLMVYFIWSSSFAVAERSLATRLAPPAVGSSATTAAQSPSPEADFPEVVVRVLGSPAGPAWSINGQPAASLADLRQTLTAIARIKSDAPVTLDPAEDVPLGDVIEAFDATRLAGFRKVRFAVKADGARANE